MPNSILTEAEQRACWKLGALAKFAEAGVKPSEIDGCVKSAANVAAALSPTNMAKMVATVAVVTGIPLGVAAHIVGQRVQKARGRERELQTQIGYYRNAAAQLDRGLESQAG